jgi:dTMP kinase
MRKPTFYGTALPSIEHAPYSGKLIVIEGTDGVGRSTHTALLRTWLESRGHAVIDTGMTRSVLAGRGIKEAKQGTTLGRLTMQLFYATDFADRLENEMLPALRAGFIVLTDRYIYSAIARAVVRGVDPRWIRSIYGVALVPDLVLYLRIKEPQELVSRLLSAGRKFDFWESGMDMHFGDDFYDSFIQYQTRLLHEFDLMTAEYGFRVVDSSRSVRRVAAELRRIVARVVDGDGSTPETSEKTSTTTVGEAAASAATRETQKSVRASERAEGTTGR